MRSIVASPIDRVSGGTTVAAQDLLAVEEPLEIRIDDQPISITMRTPGNDAELAAGFLYCEGILESAEAIEELRVTGNSVTIRLKSGVELDLDRLNRHFYTTSSCGVCGKASLAALAALGCRRLSRDGPAYPLDLIPELPGKLRTAQGVFEHTGGLHAAGLFDFEGRLCSVREDIGRHNAVDKLIGAELLAGRVPLSDRLLLLSGRASFELVQKALRAGIPLLAAVGAPSSLAVETARRYNMTLLGFVRDGRFNIYTRGSQACSTSPTGTPSL